MIRINLLPWREARRKAHNLQFYILIGMVAGLAASIILLVHGYYATRISTQTERNRFLKEENAKLEKEIAPSRKKLTNEGFLAKAPAEGVDKEKAKELLVESGYATRKSDGSIQVTDKEGKPVKLTLVTNAGSNGKFLGVLDLEVTGGKVAGFRYRLLPVFARLLPADREMEALVRKARAPFEAKLGEQLALTEGLLYRRGNFNGTFDQVICDALIEQVDAEIAFSPGFRWGTTVLPGQKITFEHVMDQTGLTYPAVTRNAMSGEMLKTILEDVADNLFNEDPFLQQGGDMVRVGGLKYAIDPTKRIGERITDMELNGKPIDPSKSYVVAGWASVSEEPPGDTGRKIWDVTAEYLRDHKSIRVSELNTPVIRGMDGNLGLEK